MYENPGGHGPPVPAADAHVRECVVFANLLLMI